MASFDLTPGAWVQVIASGGSVERVVQVNYGRVFVCFGAPDANTSPIFASTVQNKIINVPAGVEVQVRASGAKANVTTGDY